jgi:hypothetical protein
VRLHHWESSVKFFIRAAPSYAAAAKVKLTARSALQQVD